jgi:hypothetical protein
LAILLDWSGPEGLDVIDVVEGHVVTQVRGSLRELFRLRKVVVPHGLLI